MPDERNEDNQIRWAPGALDGVAGHHVGPDDARLRVKQIVKALEDLLTAAREDRLRYLYSLVTREPVLGVIDETVEEVRKNPRLRAERLHALGRVLAGEAADREGVKFGVALLGLVRGPDDEELLTTLGVHDEFTLFVAVALVNGSEDAELALWKLARRVDGWGRIHVVERLADARRVEVQAWLIREGFRNSVMDEYLAYTCAMAGNLHTALAVEAADAELLRGAAGIFRALATGGPAQDLSDYTHAGSAIEAWLSQIERRSLDMEQLDALDALISRDEVPAMLKARIERLRTDPGVLAAIETGLKSTDSVTFGRADQAARRRGVATFVEHQARLRQGHGDASYSMYRLMQEATELTIREALATAAAYVDLAQIAVGPSDRVGMGPGFAAHGLLDFVLQELGRFPGQGTDFVLAGLKSPVIRNRNTTLRTLAAWGRERWPAAVTTAVMEAAALEPVKDVKARFVRVAAGGPFDQPATDAAPDTDHR